MPGMGMAGAPPLPGVPLGNRPAPQAAVSGPGSKLVTVAPSNKTKAVFWEKLKLTPADEAQDNFWMKRVGQTDTPIDFAAIEKAFVAINRSKVNPEPSASSNSASGNSDPVVVAAAKPTKKKAPAGPKILESQRVNNLAIALKRFWAGSIEDFVIGICCADKDVMTVERSVALKSMLPKPDEVEKLTKYTGDVKDLEPAEQFAFRLAQNKAAATIVECYVVYHDANSTVGLIPEKLRAFSAMCERAVESKALHGLLQVVLVVGNFLNFGDPKKGSADAFDLGFLNKLAATKGANDITLLELVAHQADQLPGEHCLKELTTQIPNLELLQSADIPTIQSESAQTIDSVRKVAQRAKALKLRSFDDLFAPVEESCNLADNSIKELDDAFKKFQKFYSVKDAREGLKSLSDFVVELNKLRAKQEQAAKRELQEQQKRLREERALQLKSGQQNHQSSDEQTAPPNTSRLNREQDRARAIEMLTARGPNPNRNNMINNNNNEHVNGQLPRLAIPANIHAQQNTAAHTFRPKLK